MVYGNEIKCNASLEFQYCVEKNYFSDITESESKNKINF